MRLAGRGRRRLLLALLGLVAAGEIAVVGLGIVVRLAWPAAPGPVGDRPVLAGQQLWGPCAGGFYARFGKTIVVTSSGHCTSEGVVAYAADGTTVRGVFGPAARDATCPYAGHTCASSDMNYLVVADDQIPWGELNVVDLGSGGRHTIQPGTEPFGCDDIEVGDPVEFNGRNVHRTGKVLEMGEYLHDEDGAYFPCMVATDVQGGSGDSGGGFLVRGIPAGVASRSFGGVFGWGGVLGFTPLAEGLAQLGLELCTTPDCDLAPPSPGTSVGQALPGLDPDW